MSAISIWTAELDDRLEVLWAEGLSARLIGEHLGCSKSAVIGRSHRLGLPPHPHPHPPRTKAVVAKPTPPKPVLVVPPPPPPPPVRTCQYPIGHPRTRGFRYCDAPVQVLGSVYCTVHHALCYAGRAWKHASGL